MSIESGASTTRRPSWPHLILIPFTALTLVPAIWVLKMALRPEQSFDNSLSPWPTQWSIDNFVELFLEPYTLQQLANSLLISGMTTVVGISFSTTAAYALSRYRFPGRQAGLMGLLVTQMFPGTLMMIPLYQLLDFLGLLDRSLGLILVYSATAAGAQSIPASLEITDLDTAGPGEGDL